MIVHNCKSSWPVARIYGIPESPQLASDFSTWEENTPTNSFVTRSTVGADVSKRESPAVGVFQVDDLDEDTRSIVSGLTGYGTSLGRIS